MPHRLYATHRETVSARPRYSYTSPYPYSNLLRPFAFTVTLTVTTFGLAYYLDTQTTYRANPDAKLRVLAGLIVCNAVILAAHHVPVGVRARSLLARYTTLDPRKVHALPSSVLTSGFSHVEVWHFGFNMVGLYTIGSAIFDLMGQNQFLAMYLSAICWSSMAQCGVEYMRARRGQVPRVSLGASGGVYALLGAVAWYAPESSVYLIFLPFIPIKLGYAFTGMIAMDTVGLVKGWSMFGHAAHLTGGLGGLAYGMAGVPEAWIQKRRQSLKRHLSVWGR